MGKAVSPRTILRWRSRELLGAGDGAEDHCRSGAESPQPKRTDCPSGPLCQWASSIKPKILALLPDAICHSVDYIKLFQHSPIGVGVTPILNTLKYRENPPKPVTTGNRETVRTTKTHKNPTKQEMGKMIFKTRNEKPVKLKEERSGK